MSPSYISISVVSTLVCSRRILNIELHVILTSDFENLLMLSRSTLRRNASSSDVLEKLTMFLLSSKPLKLVVEMLE